MYKPNEKITIRRSISEPYVFDFGHHVERVYTVSDGIVALEFQVTLRDKRTAYIEPINGKESTDSFYSLPYWVVRSYLREMEYFVGKCHRWYQISIG